MLSKHRIYSSNGIFSCLLLTNKSKKSTYVLSEWNELQNILLLRNSHVPTHRFAVHPLRAQAMTMPKTFSRSTRRTIRVRSNENRKRQLRNSHPDSDQSSLSLVNTTLPGRPRKVQQQRQQQQLQPRVHLQDIQSGLTDQNPDRIRDLHRLQK